LAARELEELLAAFPELGKPYLLTEGTKVANLAHYLDGFQLQHVCLFDGEAYETYVDEAPYLVGLTDWTPQSEEFIWEMLDEGNGVALFSELNLKKLKMQLKKYTYGLVAGVHTHIKFFTAKNFTYVLETYEPFGSLFDSIDAAVLSAMDFSGEYMVLRASSKPDG